MICAAPVAAQTTSEPSTFELTFDQARQQGMQAAFAGENALALELANSLLDANANDGVAWYIRALALSQSGDLANGRAAARQAYIHAQSPEQRYEAAQLTALIAYNEQRLTTAQWWLRLALISAPTPETEAIVAQNLADVVRQNPWRSDISLSIAPSNNVNGGSFDEVFRVNGIDTLGNLSADALALDGWTGDLRLSTSYRLNMTETSQSFAGLRLNWHGVLLSDSSEQSLRDADRYRGNDAFSYGGVELFFKQDRSLENGAYGYDLTVGSRWSGGSRSENILRFSIDRTLDIGDDALLRFSVFAEQQWDLTDQDLDDRRLGGSATYVRAVQDIGFFSSTLAYNTTQSDSGLNRSEIWSLYGGFSPADQVGPFKLNLQLGIQNVAFDDYSVSIGFQRVLVPRTDERYFASLSAALPDYAIAGFEPVFTFDASTTDSNISRFTQDSYNLGVSFQSSF